MKEYLQIFYISMFCNIGEMFTISYNTAFESSN
jgi:hypothetical protein